MTAGSAVVGVPSVSGEGVVTSAALASEVLGVLSPQAPATNAAMRQTASAPSMSVPRGVVSFGMRVNGFRMSFSPDRARGAGSLRLWAPVARAGGRPAGHGESSSLTTRGWIGPVGRFVFRRTRISELRAYGRTRTSPLVLVFPLREVGTPFLEGRGRVAAHRMDPVGDRHGTLRLCKHRIFRCGWRKQDPGGRPGRRCRRDRP